MLTYREICSVVERKAVVQCVMRFVSGLWRFVPVLGVNVPELTVIN
jgi:hypothetical protein